MRVAIIFSILVELLDHALGTFDSGAMISSNVREWLGKTHFCLSCCLGSLSLLYSLNADHALRRVWCRR